MLKVKQIVKSMVHNNITFPPSLHRGAVRTQGVSCYGNRCFSAHGVGTGEGRHPLHHYHRPRRHTLQTPGADRLWRADQCERPRALHKILHLCVGQERTHPEQLLQGVCHYWSPHVIDFHPNQMDITVTRATTNRCSVKRIISDCFLSLEVNTQGRREAFQQTEGQGGVTVVKLKLLSQKAVFIT